MVYFCNLFIEFDEVQLLLHLVIALLDPPFYPLGEMIICDGEADVGDVLAWEFEALPFQIWQGSHDVAVVDGVIQHGLNGEALELWHLQVLDLGALDPPLSAICQVPQMEDGHGIVGGEVGAALAAQEAPDLALGLHLGAELCCGDLDWSALILWNLIFNLRKRYDLVLFLRAFQTKDLSRI